MWLLDDLVRQIVTDTVRPATVLLLGVAFVVVFWAWCRFLEWLYARV